ncbi:hypothetical protein COU15_00510 [Candidatus Kaiserbacteria bacterium CG10_big_fil_rev_8_21_14_0_10_45_20]|uniref:Uncharacterized protein n=1 Tax=Candidatus Kaiserbacteria bacterium CG10_big_fil_rev_8_21_14_0_10_45_20 TaxID=1974607 RepID=A0A2H0UGL8_9BACT|nr:MAG: hypothetical protein COU15_00510 [Candidatus Kaiserbacteria bacterium CG10_big_fil_rev_8_21_14_0_10_45_20]
MHEARREFLKKERRNPYILWPVVRDFNFLDYKAIVVDFQIIGDMPEEEWQNAITRARAEGFLGVAIVSSTGTVLYSQSFIGPCEEGDES